MKEKIDRKFYDSLLESYFIVKKNLEILEESKGFKTRYKLWYKIFSLKKEINELRRGGKLTLNDIRKEFVIRRDFEKLLSVNNELVSINNQLIEEVKRSKNLDNE